jgi:type I restriction enzyme S subunit
MDMVATKVTFQKYPAYKESGVEWLGEIPEGWEILPGLSFILEGKDKNKGMKRNTVLSLSYGNIRVKAPEELTGLVPESFETYQLVNKGDLIFRPTDLQNDKVSLRSSISNYEGIITSAYLNLRFKTKASPKFYHYLFRAIDNNKVIYGLGSGLRQNISYLDFRRFIFPYPPKEEQTAIANFLDEKTTKIDQAIAQKEQLIALLKERKQIIIQNAVTKGLNPNVKLKDSGVEWIEEIPEHWEVKRLKHLVDSRTGFAFPSDQFEEEGLPLIRIGDLDASGEVTTSDSAKLPKEFEKYLKDYGLRNGDLLFAMTGGTIGKVAKFYGQEKALLNQRVCSITIEEPIFRTLIYNWMNTKYWKDFIDLHASGGAQPNISDKDVLELPIVISSINSETTVIVKHIEAQSAKIVKAIALQQTQIEKLKEYKATIIDSAVTGKIKVTDYGK